MNAQGFPCQNSNTLPRSSHPMSPRTTMLRRRQKKKEHKSSRKSGEGLGMGWTGACALLAVLTALAGC